MKRRPPTSTLFPHTPPSPSAPPKPINLNYAAPDSSAPTLPRDKGIPPERPERKHAGAPDAVLARPLSVASDPVATGRPRPGHPRPRSEEHTSELQSHLHIVCRLLLGK